MHRCRYARLLGAVVLSGCHPAPPPPAAAAPPGLDLRVEATSPLPLGNVAVRPTGEILVSLHPFFAPPFNVGTLRHDQVLPLASDVPFVSVLGLRVDGEGGLWLLDGGGSEASAARVVHLPAAGGEAQVFPLAEATQARSFVNDLVVDLGHQAIYIADPTYGAEAALIVVDTASRVTRRVLAGHRAVMPEAIDLRVGDRLLQTRGPDGFEKPLRVGVNPIALDAAAEWLYFGPMHATSLYRVPTAALRDGSLSAEALAARVQRFADKPICDGIVIDAGGNIYLGDLAHDALGVIDAQGHYRVLSADPRLRFVNSFSHGPDGRLYATAGQVDRAPPFNQGESRAEPPFLLFGFTPLAR